MTQIGRYIVGAELGRGGMGAVYTARDPGLDRHVAIKVIAPELARDPAFVSRFLREVRIAATLEHPNVVPVYEAGESDGTLYMVMRLIPGQTLQDAIDDHGALAPGRAAALGRQLGSALDAAHSRGLVHRDVKPANVLLSRSGDQEHLFLADFGLARDAASTSGVTETGQWIGTVDFVAPEILNQSGQASARSDVYSMSCLLFQSLTGRVPYAGPVARKLAGHAVEPLPSIGHGFANAPAIDAVLARGAAKDPADRFPSAGELAAAFDDAVNARAATPRAMPRAMPAPTVLDTAPQVARTPVSSSSVPGDSAARRSSNRGWVVPVAVAVLALVAGGLVAAGLAGRGNGQDASVATRTIERVTTVISGTTQTVTNSRVSSGSTEPTGSASSVEPAFAAGRYVQFGSFRTSARANEAVDRLRAAGVDASVLASDGADELLPWFKVAVAGPISSTTEGDRMIRAARSAGVKDAFIRPLTPTVRAAAPTGLVGTFSGSLRQTSAGDTVSDKRLPVTMTFADGGQSGAITYDNPSCQGTLTLDATDGSVGVYQETIDEGNCTPGGAWRIRPTDSGIGATWRKPERYYFVSGRLR